MCAYASFFYNIDTQIYNLNRTMVFEYWKILNMGQKKKQPNISNDVLYDFSKNLNGAPDHDDVALSVLSESLQENLDFDNLNIHLNDSTRGEISACQKCYLELNIFS
jgi:hypothetical protein